MTIVKFVTEPPRVRRAIAPGTWGGILPRTATLSEIKRSSFPRKAISSSFARDTTSETHSRLRSQDARPRYVPHSTEEPPDIQIECRKKPHRLSIRRRGVGKGLTGIRPGVIEPEGSWLTTGSRYGLKVKILLTAEGIASRDAGDAR